MGSAFSRRSVASHDPSFQTSIQIRSLKANHRSRRCFPRSSLLVRRSRPARRRGTLRCYMLSLQNDLTTSWPTLLGHRAEKWGAPRLRHLLEASSSGGRVNEVEEVGLLVAEVDLNMYKSSWCMHITCHNVKWHATTSILGGGGNTYCW
jgi:hypothetical protein